MDVGNLSHCDMHNLHEGGHALTHKSSYFGRAEPKLVRTVGNAATWNWMLYKVARYPARENKPNNYDSDT